MTISPIRSMMPLPVLELPNPDYEEMVRRIKPDERLALENTIAQLKNTDKVIDNLLSELAEDGWGSYGDSDTIRAPDMPYYALVAFKRGQLTDLQFATLLFYRSACEHLKEQQKGHRITANTLFDSKGKLNQDSFDMIAATLQNSELNTMGLDREQLGEWIEKVKKLEPSEKQYFDISSSHDKSRILDTIYSLGFSAFNSVDGNVEIIPTFGMVQAFLNVKYGEDAVQIRPVIGASTLTEVHRTAFMQIRDVALHFPNVTLPTEADEQTALWEHYTKHDFYHCAKASEIPHWIRKQIGHASFILRNEEIEDPEQLRSVRRAAFYLYDMDHPEYNNRTLRKVAFWTNLERAFKIPEYVNQVRDRLKKDGKRFTPIETKIQEQLIKKICQRIIASNIPLIDLEPEFPTIQSYIEINKTKWKDPFLLPNLDKLQTISKIYQETKTRKASFGETS